MDGLLNEMVNKNRELEKGFVKEQLGDKAIKEDDEMDMITGEPEEPIKGEVPPKGESEKVYLGHKGEVKYFMLLGGGDIKVEDEEGKEILSAQAEGIATEDIGQAVREILKSGKLELDEVDYPLYMEYIEPILAAEAGEDKGKEEPEPGAEEPGKEIAEEPAPEQTEGKAPAIPPKDEQTLVKELMEKGNYDVLAAEIMSRDIAEELAKGKEAHVVEDVDGAFGAKGKFVVIKAKAIKEAEQPAVPPQKGEDPLPGAKLNKTGQTETQPAVPPQKGDDVMKGAKTGATGEVAKQTDIPKQEGEEVTKGPETTSVKGAEKLPPTDKLTLENLMVFHLRTKKEEDDKKKKAKADELKKKEEDDKKKKAKADELKKKHGLKK